VLNGKPLDETNARRAAEVAFAGATTRGDNDYKRELGKRTVVRGLLQAAQINI
jgi:xanthine dehydrogenase YagS FAD-binding subunit